MKNHNYTIGIDYIADGDGNVALSNYYFVDAVGGDDNSLDASNPVTPFQNVNSVITTYGGEINVVMGSGKYDYRIVSDQTTFWGDGEVILDGDGVAEDYSIVMGSNRKFIAHGLIFRNYPYAFNNGKGSNELYDCVFENTSISRGGSGFGRYDWYVRCVFRHTSVATGYEGDYGRIHQCRFYNSPLNLKIRSVESLYEIHSTYFDNNSPISIEDVVNGDESWIIPTRFRNNFTTADYTTDLGTYNLAAFQLQIPGIESGTQTGNPKFKGAPVEYQMVVEEDSPLLNNGEGGLNIGNVTTGYSIDTTSAELVTPLSVANIEISGNELVLENGFNVGNIRSGYTDLGDVFDSSLLQFNHNAVIDFVVNYPDADTITLPDWLIFEASWMDETNTESSVRKFKTGRLDPYPFKIDATGKSSGEDGFNPNSASGFLVSQISIKTTLKSV